MHLGFRGWLGAVVIALAVAWFSSPGWAEEKAAAGRGVAVVNGSVISQADLDREVDRVRQMFLSRGRPLSDSQVSQLQKEVLESLINRELLYQESRKQGVKVDEAAVDAELKGLKARFAGEAGFKKALEHVGLSEEDLRSQIREDMAVRQLVEGLFASKIAVSDKESKAYYETHARLFKRPEEVRASHILIRVDPDADESEKAAAREEVVKIQKKLRDGEDFAALAKEFSQGPSGAKGGDLNYIRRGQMVKAFEDVAFSLKPGEVSDIVETKFGYHLIKVTDRRPEAVIPYDEVKAKIERYLRQQKIQTETRRYVETLKKKAQIERF